MKYFALSCVLVALCLTAGVFGTASSSFEDGVTTQWYNAHSYYTFTAVDGGAASTTKSARLTGGDGNNRDGPVLYFEPFAPASISFWVKAGAVGNLGSVTIGLGNETSNSAVTFRFTDSGVMGVLVGSNYQGTQAYVVDTWYNIRFDFDWIGAPGFEYYVDNVLQYSGGVFANPSLTQLSSFWFSNNGVGNSQVSYIDEVYIGCPNGCNGKSCDANGKCICNGTACGVDCASPTTALQFFTPITKTSTAGTYYYTFDAAGEGFSVTVDKVVDVYIRALSDGTCASASNTAFYPTYSNGNTRTNVSTCTAKSESGLYSIAVILDQTYTYTINVIYDPTRLVNNKKSVGTSSSKFVYKVPQTTNPSNTLTFTLETSSYTYFLGSNKTDCVAYGYVSYTTSTSSAYTSTQTITNAIPGDSWSWMTNGYSASVSVTAVLKDCDKFCSNGGVCANNKCDCPAGWTGDTCTVLECPNNCNNRGTCTNGVCTSCSENYSGPSCECYAPKLEVGKYYTGSYAGLNFAYYSIDTTNYPNGIWFNVSTGSSSVYPNIYIGTQCSTNTYSWSTSISTSSNYGLGLLSACDIQSYGPKIVIGLYDYGQKYPFNINIYAATPLTAENLVPRTYTPTSAGITTFAFDAPATVTGSLDVTVQYNSYYYDNQAYISLSPCYTGTNLATDSSKESLKMTVPGATPGRYYIMVYSRSYNTFTLNIRGANCATNCGANGICINNKCECNNNYGGATCQDYYDCSSLNSCNNHGTCGVGNKCTCYPGYTLANCNCEVANTVSNGDIIYVSGRTRYLVNTTAYANGAILTVKGNNANSFYASLNNDGTCPTSANTASTARTITFAPACGSTGGSGNPTVLVLTPDYAGVYNISVTPSDNRLTAGVQKQFVATSTYSPFWIYDAPDNQGFIISLQGSSCSAISNGLYAHYGSCPDRYNYTQAAPYNSCNDYTLSGGRKVGSLGWSFKNKPAGRYYIMFSSYETVNATINIQTYAELNGASSFVPSVATILLVPLLSIMYHLLF